MTSGLFVPLAPVFFATDSPPEWWNVLLKGKGKVESASAKPQAANGEQADLINQA